VTTFYHKEEYSAIFFIYLFSTVLIVAKPLKHLGWPLWYYEHQCVIVFSYFYLTS